MKAAVKKSTRKNTNGNRGESAADLQEQISRRAYELYERRGREAGHEVEDWLRAEAELASERSKPLTGEKVRKIRQSRSQKPEKEKPSSLSKSRSASQIKSEAD